MASLKDLRCLTVSIVLFFAFAILISSLNLNDFIGFHLLNNSIASMTVISSNSELVGDNEINILLLSMRIGNPVHFKGSDSENEKKYKIITENKRKYAARHSNIDFEERNTRMKSGFIKDLRYQKTFFLREVLQSEKYSAYDYFVWMDADMLFMNCSISLSELIKKESINVHGKTPPSDKLPDLIFSKDHWGINNGIFAISNSQWSLQFVKNWTYPVESDWHNAVIERCRRLICDQGMFIAILFGMDVSKKHSLQQIKAVEHKGFSERSFNMSMTEYMQLMREDAKEHVAMIPRKKWNSYPSFVEDEYNENLFNRSEYDDGKNNGFILHLTGASKKSLAMDEIITKESNC